MTGAAVTQMPNPGIHLKDDKPPRTQRAKRVTIGDQEDS
jgi:hypothetical protein